MKNRNIYLLTCLALAFSCSDSATDEFEEVNGDTEEKLIKSISVISMQDSYENQTISFSYNNEKKLNSVSNGEESSLFIYGDDNLTNVTGGGDQLNIEELYQSPYDAFETGQVQEYDNNGNPYKISFINKIYNEDTYEYENVDYTAEISYDDTPNPFFYTLKAAGIIDVLDGVELNFSLPQQAANIIKARTLLPLNNPSKITYKNELGNIVYDINVEYTYDEQEYPISATVTAISLEVNETGTYSVVYQYL
ncbi:hypothetical protein [Aestuariibaculum sediminum]|uniref:DUF4595 domain-containing protein n=1 Tax=Aestuariibaculum sediminum TaxID=2770637 RepID=A0A8J6UBS5_9FLAO|nr:hypothetical protein [Aestuariibaculum sediminum]MBD0831314.1 hypothetical protein [Aestuariibaculum sediminum]